MPAMVAPRKTSSAASRSLEPASFSTRASIRLQLAHRAGLVASPLVKAGQVEMRVGVERIDGDSALVRGDGVDREVEQLLSRLRIPDRVAIADDDARAVRRDADAGQGAFLRKLRAQHLQRALHLALRDLRQRQLRRRAQHDQVLKSEAKLA